MSVPTPLFVRTTAPTLAQEPVTINEAKRACGLPLDGGYHDADIVRYIAMARAIVEYDNAIACYTGTYTRKINSFPCGDWFEINISPVTAIAITYLDTSGATQTFSSTNYTLDTSGIIPIVKLNYGYVWPAVQYLINPITLTVTAGYTTVTDVPAIIKTAVLTEVVRQFKMEAGEDVRGYDAAYESLITRIGRETYA